MGKLTHERLDTRGWDKGNNETLKQTTLIQFKICCTYLNILSQPPLSKSTLLPSISSPFWNCDENLFRSLKFKSPLFKTIIYIYMWDGGGGVPFNNVLDALGWFPLQLYYSCIAFDQQGRESSLVQSYSCHHPYLCLFTGCVCRRAAELWHHAAVISAVKAAFEVQQEPNCPIYLTDCWLIEVSFLLLLQLFLSFLSFDIYHSNRSRLWRAAMASNQLFIYMRTERQLLK